MSNYSRIIQSCWESLLAGSEPNGSYFFSKQDIENAARNLGLSVKNIADIRYTFDSREDLPFSGYGILQQGKGQYVFVPVESNLIDPLEIDQAMLLPDSLSGLAARYVTKDEQGALAKIYASGALNYISDFSDVSRIQDHWRTTSHNGQIEIDSLASCRSGGVETLLVINVKRDSDRISKTYLYNQNRLAASKFDVPYQILNVYCHDDSYLIWSADSLQDLQNIAAKPATLVRLY